MKEISNAAMGGAFEQAVAPTPAAVTLRRLIDVIVRRAERWQPHTERDAAGWALRMAGMVGELCDLVEQRASPATIADGLARLVCAAPLLAQQLGIELEAAIIATCDEVSQCFGFPDRLGEGARAVFSFGELREVNRAHFEAKHAAIQQWPVENLTCALADRVIEVVETLAGHKRHSEPAAAAIGGKLADAVIYLDLVAQRLGLDLGAEVLRKFDRASPCYDLPHRRERAG